MGAWFRWVKYIYEWVKNFAIGGFDAYFGRGLGYPVQFHVSKDGLDTNNGLSWSKAFLTIQAGLDAVGELDEERGGGIVLVGPGYYVETLQTPLNADGAFGQLIGVSPTDVSHGAVYVTSEAVGEAWLTVRARGWRISGFEIDCPTAEAGIKLDQENDGCLANYTQIDHCHFTAGLYGIDAIGAPMHVTIKDNEFSMLQVAGARAITATAGINCNIWKIISNLFVACINNIYIQGAQALQSSTIKDNTIHYRWSPGGTADSMIQIGGGQANVIHDNFLGGDFSIAGGYQGSATDEWYGNRCSAGVDSVADPA